MAATAPPSAPQSRPLDESRQWPYLAAAAVLTTFDAETLQPLQGSPHDEDCLSEMLLDCAEPIKAGPARGRWRLRDDARYRAFVTLRTRERIHDALQANTVDRAADPTAGALADLVHWRLPRALAGRNIHDLLALDLAVQWLEPTDVVPLPRRDAIRAHIQREKLLEPLRRLCVGFEGRSGDLVALRSYVDTLPSATIVEAFSRFSERLLNRVFKENPPFFIWGPGGAGKSTLIGKFILEHAETDLAKPMVFVLLDFDRVTLDPTRPDTLLAEVITQLGVQAPELSARFVDLQQGVASRLGGEDVYQPERSSHYADSERLRVELCEVLGDIARSTGQHVLFVVDTFEVVQRRGPTAVYGVLDLVVTLMAAVPWLRVVMIGRSELRDQDFFFAERPPKLKARFLGGFDTDSGRAYLRRRLESEGVRGASDADLNHIVLQVRGNPLGLRLAAAVFVREGRRGIDDAIDRQQIQEAIAEEQIQGMLHQRIVGQLEGDVQKIANPGLIVRRLTVEVIREVLAGPCDLELATTPAEVLFGTLRGEASLFEDVDATTLRHRPDVRLIMLPSLRRELGDKARLIDAAAVTYWSTQEGPAARAEELYHRMWRGDPGHELDARWLPQAAYALEDAADEFSSIAPSDEARIWLAGKLKRELPYEIRKRASQRAWERDVERNARRLLADGMPDEALHVLLERSVEQRIPASALWLVEIDVFLVKGDNQAARATIKQATERLDDTIDARYTLELLTRQVTVDERAAFFDAAYDTAQRALALARTTRMPALVFGCGVTVCRLARKIGGDEPDDVSPLIDELIGMLGDDAVQAALQERPALLREAAAELGSHMPSLLVDALTRLGLETLYPNMEAGTQLPPEVTSILRVPGHDGPPGRGRTGPRIERQGTAERLANYLREGDFTLKTVKAVANLFKDSVDRLIQ